jgi:tRNA A58 N-methylase Trm61
MAETDALHEDQIAYWNGAGGTRWVAQQERTDTVMAEIAALTIERARVQPGETVLEIGCGCGGATRGLSQAVGPKGEVLALDVSAPILVSAVRRFSEASNIKFKMQCLIS